MANLALIDLVNAALATLGEQPLTDLKADFPTPTQVIVSKQVDLVTRSLLMEADWNFARITAKLSKIPNNDLVKTGYTSIFQLPKDPALLRIVQISTDGGNTFVDFDKYYNHIRRNSRAFFDIDGDTLLSDTDSKDVYIKYIGIVDHSKFDALFADAFVARLASELSYAITASTTNAEYLARTAARKLMKAKSRNNMNRNPDNMYDGDVIAARYSYGGERLRADMSDEMEG